MNNTIIENWHRTQEQIKIASLAAGRSASEVNLLAVSKHQPIEKIIALYQLGQRHFGENYAQELLNKRTVLVQECPDIHWHFIGHIQTNKAMPITECFMVHSVGSIRHARALNSCTKNRLPILLQLNLDDALSRNGFGGTDIEDAVGEISLLPRLELRGLMAVLPLASVHSVEFWFQAVREIRNQLEISSGIKLPDLSMGMSADFNEAIAHGATWIRLGSSLFGAR